jgi:DNA-binding transcriptional regulator PaaX
MKMKLTELQNWILKFCWDERDSKDIVNNATSHQPQVVRNNISMLFAGGYLHRRQRGRDNIYRISERGRMLILEGRELDRHIRTDEIPDQMVISVFTEVNNEDKIK